MRERLIELLRQPIPIIKGYATVGETRMSIVDAENIADRLLANGIIVPPCKVGDTVYYISGFDGYEKICGKKVKRIWFDNEGFVFTVRGMYMDFNIPENELYITREEAEKALKEAKG